MPVERVRQKSFVYKNLVGLPERKAPLELPRHRVENNIKTDLKKIRCQGLDWINL